MLATAELVGGPIDGARFDVPSPPPFEWRRRAAPSGADVISFAGDLTVTEMPTHLERYVRDDQPDLDGVWHYRWARPTS